MIEPDSWMITKLLNCFPYFVQTWRYIRHQLVTQRCQTTMQGKPFVCCSYEFLKKRLNQVK
ncbi:hypothetical protein Hanom_Chr09g00785741 [Helianthus anomalus]